MVDERTKTKYSSRKHFVIEVIRFHTERCSMIAVENREHYLHIHLEHEIITFYCTIKEMEKRLEGKPFFRCNSGLIVNLAKVQSVRNNEIQIHGETLTVSRSRKKEFMELLTEYMGEGEYV